MTMDGDSSWDALVIGSGMGGLAAAALLARYRGWRVCVLERHSTAGGFTHTFRRPGGWEWDVGVHYVGQMAAGETARQVMDVVTGGSVQWEPLPEPFDRVHYPGLDFCFGGVPEQVRADLKAAFPAEGVAIDRYFADVKSAARRLSALLPMHDLPSPARWMLGKIGLLSALSRTESTGAYLERRFRDPRLRALLASFWGDYGIPPKDSAFPLHALIVAHYQNGAWYPRGGASAIARGALGVIAAAGGGIRRRHTVRRILIEGGRAVGVEAVTRYRGRDQTVVMKAPVVTSGAGALNTYRDLLPSALGAVQGSRLAGYIEPLSAATVYLGLRGSPSGVGLRGENVWIFDGFDHDRVVSPGGRGQDAPPHVAYLSLASMRASDGRPHTAEIITFPPTEITADWRGTPWHKRGDDYGAFKEKIADELLAMVERHYPGFGALVAYREVSTPLSVEHFVGSPRGAIYGLPGTADRYRELGILGVRTPIPGLLLTGADAFVPGVVGAMFAGVAAAGAALGRFGFFQLISFIKRSRSYRRA